MIAQITGMVRQIFRVWGNKTDGDNQQKLETVKKYRDTDKAMDASEKQFFATDSFLDGKITKRQFQHLHEKYWKLYFKYN